MKEVSLANLLSFINDKLESINILPSQVTDDLSELGMNSIMFVQLIVDIEIEFECEFPDSKLILTETNTVAKIYEIMQQLSLQSYT